MNWLPSHRVPPFPAAAIDWRLKAAFGKGELARLWQELWWSGVAAGRAEGIVGTLLAVLVLAVVVLVLVMALRSNR